MFEHSKLIWKPLAPHRTRAEALRRLINHKHSLQLSTSSNSSAGRNSCTENELEDYHDLHKYSVENVTFWLDLWEFMGIVYSVAPSKVTILKHSLVT